VSSGIENGSRGYYRRFHVLKLSLATVAVAALAGVAAVAAPAADTPVVGSTTTTTCTFDHGATHCREQTITVTAESCFDVGLRLYETAEVDSARTYRGDAVLPGLDGATVEGEYADVVRPHSRLSYDSGPHAFSFTVPAEDPTCTG
jgi:hypothetical protein